MSKFWGDEDEAGPPVSRATKALAAHNARVKGKVVTRTLASYKVKYTVMSKESKHFLELVVQKLMQCWRVKQKILRMKSFYKWVQNTMSMSMDHSQELRALKTKLREEHSERAELQVSI